MDADRNLLFGVIALQADLIEPQQFIDACLLWTRRKDAPLAEVLLERGWIEPEDRAHVDYLLARKLAKHGDARASLAALPDQVKCSLAALEDEDIQHSLAGLPVEGGRDSATVVHVPGPAGRYSRLRLHASGGIGRVWLARDGALGRDVALKELRPERADQAAYRKRFLQEARITGQLEHPGIVPVYELVRDGDDQVFYTMRFVKGRTLSEASRAFHQKRAAGDCEALDLPALLNAFVTVCNTVAYAHSRGVLHRDLKGPNIVLGEFGEVVVLDWGLAKRVGQQEGPAVDGAEGGDSAHTVQGRALGTPAYMAPEQAAGRLEQIDQRTDVYGLGAVLYEVLTGQPPFSGPDMATVLRKVQEEEPAPAHQFWPEVPPALEALCLRALAKAPADRPASASELAQEVQGWQERERRQAEEALRESEALYHSLVESLPCSVWRKDVAGRFTFANQRACEQLGLPLDQVLGKTVFEVSSPAAAERYHRADQEVLATGRVFEDILEHPATGGKGPRYVHMLKTAVRDADGKVVGIQGIAWDVTERKLAEEELRKSRERFELAVRGSQDGLWDWDLITNEVYYSPRYETMLGYEEGAFTNRPEEFSSRVHPEDFDRVREELRALFESREPLSWIECRIRHKDGSYRWVRSRGYALRDANGRVVRMAGSHEDITDRKNAEAELAYERDLLHTLMNHSPDGIYFKDTAGRFLRVNQAVSDALGLAHPEQAIGKTDFDFFTEEYAREAAAEVQELIQRGLSVVGLEKKVPWLDGRERWLSISNAPFRDRCSNVIGTVAIARDITERKQAEEELRQAKERLQLAVEGSQDGLFDFNIATGEVYWSPRYKAMLGYEDKELPSCNEEWLKRIHPEDLDRVRDESAAFAQSRANLSEIEFRLRHKDGSYRWFRSRAIVVRDANGQITRFAGSHEDITDRKTVAEQLRHAQDRLAQCEEELQRLANR